MDLYGIKLLNPLKFFIEVPMSSPRVIAFYLPQYHPTPDNDRWWGKGFTEWTNVGKAKPLFRRHYQPKVPADLGYYDLRLSEVREEQALLAKEAGIYGFCYYHYWFGNGKEELELPFNEVLKSGKPDFPFMLCWANESWHRKFWNKDGKGTSKEILIEQTYPGDEDHINHFYRLLPAFKDARYIKYENKPVFMIYVPSEFPHLESFIKQWNGLAKKAGFDGIYFIGQVRVNSSAHIIPLLEKGLNGVNTVRLVDSWDNGINFIKLSWRRIKRKFFNIPHVVDFRNIYSLLLKEEDSLPNVFPTLVPNWDHTPRSGIGGTVLTHSTPKLFGKQIRMMHDACTKKDSGPNIIFLKSWNEWGEGNYVEPDIKYGKGYLEEIMKIFNR